MAQQEDTLHYTNTTSKKGTGAPHATTDEEMMVKKLCAVSCPLNWVHCCGCGMIPLLCPAAH